MKTQQPFNYKDVKVGSVYCENYYYFLVVKIIKDDNGWIHVHYLDYRGQLGLSIGVPDCACFTGEIF
jgi:hypothetical protein